MHRKYNQGFKMWSNEASKIYGQMKLMHCMRPQKPWHYSHNCSRRPFFKTLKITLY